MLKFSKLSERLLHPERVVIAALLMLVGCSLPAQQRLSSNVPATQPHFGTWGFGTDGMNPAAKPGDNFFLYANGDWIKKASIPPNRTKVGPFSDLRQLCAEQVHTLVEKTHNDRLDSDEGRVHTLYQAFMDESAIEQQGARPLQRDLQ